MLSVLSGMVLDVLSGMDLERCSTGHGLGEVFC